MIHLLGRIMLALSHRWMRISCNVGLFREIILGGSSQVDDRYYNWSRDPPGTGCFVPVELHPYSERIPARCYLPPGPGHAYRHANVTW